MRASATRKPTRRLLGTLCLSLLALFLAATPALADCENRGENCRDFCVGPNCDLNDPPEPWKTDVPLASVNDLKFEFDMEIDATLNIPSGFTLFKVLDSSEKEVLWIEVDRDGLAAPRLTLKYTMSPSLIGELALGTVDNGVWEVWSVHREVWTGGPGSGISQITVERNGVPFQTGSTTLGGTPDEVHQGIDGRHGVMSGTLSHEKGAMQ